MTTALAERTYDTAVAPVVTPDQMDLIRRTIAQGATPDELKLYLYDCQRQGVHPLDRLLHFTKRGGKYTPITSIDLMRTRAHETGECAGIDDPTFRYYDDDQAEERPTEATVIVYRLVQGQKCGFAATARWSEYKPEQNDFMWKRMPHTMLGKCAEALALRKAFPKQLAGLYAREEMDQAGGGNIPVVVEAPASPSEPLPDLPPDAVLLRKSEALETSRGKKYWLLVTHAGEEVVTWEPQLGVLAEQLIQERVPCVLTLKNEWDGKPVVKAIHRLGNGPKPIVESASAPTLLDVPEKERAF